MDAQSRFASAPRRIYWELTRACDLACRHCRAEAMPQADPEELDGWRCLDLLIRLEGFGRPAPHLVLTGGDPLKFRGLYALVEAGRARGLPISLAPAATPMLTPAAVQRMKQAGVVAISLSLDGSSAQSHDTLRGVPGTFVRTLEAARAARDCRLPFQVNTLVSSETLDDLPAVHNLVNELGASRWALFFLIATGRGAELQPILPKESEDLLHWLAALQEEGGARIATVEAPQYRRILVERGHTLDASEAGIRDGNGIMFISRTGDVCPSGFLPCVAGNVCETDPVELYRDSPLFRGLRDPDRFAGRCGRCAFRSVCGGSRARAYAAHGDPYAEDPLCGYEPSPGREAVCAGAPGSGR